MDKNTVTGLVLMALVFFGFMWFTTPSEEEQRQQQEQLAKQEQEQKKKQEAANVVTLDSISAEDLAQLRQNIKDCGGDSATLANENVKVSLSGDNLTGTIKVNDTTVNVADVLAYRLDKKINNEALGKLIELNDYYTQNGLLASKMTGENQIFKLQNDSIQLEISSKGGMISRATLVNYGSAHKTKNAASNKVEVFTPNENTYSFLLSGPNSKIDTKDYFFTGKQVNDTTVEMTLDCGQGAKFGYRYTLAKGGNYMVRMEIIQENMQKVLGVNANSIDFSWNQKMSRHEKGNMFEDRNSTFYYRYAGDDDDVDYLNESSDGDKNLEGDHLKWVSTKNQFFSAVFIADGSFTGGSLKTHQFDKDSADYKDYLKDLAFSSSIDYEVASKNPASFFLYLGPNRYRILNNYEDMMAQYKSAKINDDEDLELTRLIPLGWTLFRWINVYIVIPVFNFLSSFIGNFGIIILILTLLIKILIFPLTNKMYRSQAVMKILAPDVKAINEKYPGKDNAMKRQQKTQALYSSAGASMFGGCLPMLLQMPILIAVFAFFPSCIELRGVSFLWAHDLSAPDMIVEWTGQIWFVTNYFGNHISLFCLLMTATNIMYTYLTTQSQQQQEGMPNMKWMMYLMPVFFLVFFNNYAAGLSYYYFISLLLTIVQTYATRYFIKEDKVRALMAENNKKPKKKSGFMARLEEAQRMQQQQLNEQKKKNNRR